ncbi:MAG TPA: tyrosine-type recombinase/integrase [Candidatus Eremiobacteraceae bacterium]|nr:tyrosine-type recombinase/integrase [Candidatus Eremiobacteraceae bacterium]
MIYKRGNTYWYKFMWHGKLIRESTKQGNDKVARQMESAHRTALAKGEVGIREKKPVPILSDFIEKRIEPWAKGTFEKSSPKTWRDYYRVGLLAIKNYKPLANMKLDEITSETVADFAAYRQSLGLQVSTVNSSLQVLRRTLRLAVEWGTTKSAPIVKMLPGERHRERVVTLQEESKYLYTAPEPLGSIARVLIDTGLRPEECFRLRWESLTWTNGRYGSFLVTHGKTAAARRVLPMTPRVRHVLETRWERAGKPLEGWVWPAATRSGHLEGSSIKKQHAKALRMSKVRRFVLYSLRHTFLTRLGESGCDVWTLARIAGHSSVAMSTRYVHPSEEAVLSALERLGGHKIGHIPESATADRCAVPQLPS